MIAPNEKIADPIIEQKKTIFILTRELSLVISNRINSSVNQNKHIAKGEINVQR
jgi:hypothetical protein